MGTYSTRCSDLRPSHLGFLNGSTLLSEGETRPGDEPDLPPSEFDEEYIAELATQAEEAELWANLDDADTLFSFSDINDIDVTVHATLDDDVCMA